MSPQAIAGFHLCLFVAATAATGALALGLLLLHFSVLWRFVGTVPFALIAGGLVGRYGLAEAGPQDAQTGWAIVEPIIANGAAEVFRLLQAVTVGLLVACVLAYATTFAIALRRRLLLAASQHTQLIDMEAELA